MIEIEIILGSKYGSPWRKDMICLSSAPVLIVAKSVLANRGIVNEIMAWTINGQLQSDGGEIS
jgi:hypothetical protein